MTEIDSAPSTADMMAAVSFSGLDDEDYQTSTEMNNINGGKRKTSSFNPPPPLSSFQVQPMANRTSIQSTLLLHSITASPSTQPPPLTALNHAREFLVGLSLELGNSDNTTSTSDDSPSNEFQQYQPLPSSPPRMGLVEGSSTTPNALPPSSSSTPGGEQMPERLMQNDAQGYENAQHESRSTRLLLDRVEQLKRGVPTTTKQAATAAFSNKNIVATPIVQGTTVSDRYRWCCDNVRMWCKASTLGFPLTDDGVDEVESLWRADTMDTSRWGRGGEEDEQITKQAKALRKGVPARLPQLPHVLRLLSHSSGGGGGASQGGNNRGVFNHPLFLADEEGTLSLGSVTTTAASGSDAATKSIVPQQVLPPVCNKRGIIPLLLALLAPSPSPSFIITNIVRLDLSNCEMDDLVVRFLTHGSLLPLGNNFDKTTSQTHKVATRGLLSGLTNLVELDIADNPLISSRGGQWLYAYISGGIISTRANTNGPVQRTIILSSKRGEVVAIVPVVASPSLPSSPTAQPRNSVFYSPDYDIHTVTTHTYNTHLVSVIMDGCVGIQSRSIRAIQSVLREKSKALLEGETPPRILK